VAGRSGSFGIEEVLSLAGVASSLLKNKVE